MRGVYAIGDVTGEPMLAHRAMAQGEMVAEIVAGPPPRCATSAAIPAVCFTDPEIVTVGLSPEEARAAGREVKTGQFPFQANGRAHDACAARTASCASSARADNHLVLGIQAVGAGVSELSGGVRPGDRDGRAAGRHRRHHPRPSDPGRGLPGGRASGRWARRCTSRLAASPHALDDRDVHPQPELEDDDAEDRSARPCCRSLPRS